MNGRDGVELRSLRAGHRVDPLGLPPRGPLLSWTTAGTGTLDLGRGYEVTVGSDPGLAEPIWQRRGLTVPRTVYDGERLGSRARRYWRVAATTTGGGRVMSETASFEVGLAEPADWEASWIAGPLLPHRRESYDPCPYLRTEFTLEDAPAHARLYATALGLYRVWVNGTEVTEDALLRPGWTDYGIRVHHQTFDCTGLFRKGPNTIAVALAKGWYAGRVGLVREPGLYGDRPAFLAQAEIVTGGGGVRRVVSDGSWRAGHGALLASDMLRGETQDRRLEPDGWRSAGFDDRGWTAAEVVGPPDAEIVPQPHDSIRVHEVHAGRLVHEHARGPAVFDFGQNLVGWTRLETTAEPSVELIVRHGEILTPDNLVYRDNLRGAFQEDRYTVGDHGPHRLETDFTVHGFRYAEVWGLPTVSPHLALKVRDDTSVSAVSIETGHDRSGAFECSDERLTALSSAVEWTVRDNFLEVATDCPQRDERLGWLGDAGVIAPTAAYHFHVGAFYAKFAQDAADAQTEDGAIRSYVPVVPPGHLSPGAPGWADGYVRIVHLLLERYGDTVTAERHFDAIARYLAHVDRNNPDGIRREAVGANFGDWLSIPERPGETVHPGYAYTGAFSTAPKDVHATAHTYRSHVQFAEIAARLGRTEIAARHAERAEEIRSAYLKAFLTSDRTIDGATQTVYAQAVGFGLVRGEDAVAVAGHLRDLVERVGHVTTGIHGVEHVLPVLARNGHADLAGRLLLREEMPGWLHMIRKGGTTIWEKWDGIAEDGTLSTAEMNSFNHCALGAVGRYLFEDVAGLDASSTAWDGVVRVRPSYPEGLDWAKATYDSAAGTVRSAWRREDGRIVHELDLPPAARAEVTPPDGLRLTNTPAGAAGTAAFGPGRHTLVLTAEGRS
ncbi:family 78 glycoside hydrolase catalytic domain [Actinomadura sp. 1N219]|uniref:family 78 glycoside hydrolase catalytic domain n=1 Tax=Actinomadura sp. 1N219 TaxID=3375152 RepID=UPI0037ABF46B